jgi:hypothetical protein
VSIPNGGQFELSVRPLSRVKPNPLYGLETLTHGALDPDNRNLAPPRTRKPRPEHWLHNVRLGSLPEASSALALSVAQEGSRSAGVDSRPALIDPPDDPKTLLLAAKALVFCGFPY